MQQQITHSWKEITVRTDFWLDKHPLQKSRQTFLITLFSRKMVLTYFKEMCLEKKSNRFQIWKNQKKKKKNVSSLSTIF